MVEIMKCFSPMSVPRPNGTGATDRVMVPCGLCLACLQNKRAEWSFRLQQELRGSKSAFFVTLTYNELFLPYRNFSSDVICRGYDLLSLEEIDDYGKFIRIPTLVKKDFQDYMKRLRLLNSNRLKYYAVGEYGDVTRRPHYHMILFNAVKSTIEDAWRVADGEKDGRMMYVPIGMVDIGSVTDASIHYVTGYVMGKRRYQEPQEKPFSLMSKRLGERYIEMDAKLHEESQEAIVRSSSGYKMKMPRYFEDRIFTPEELEEIKLNRKKYVDSEEFSVGRVFQNEVKTDRFNKRNLKTKL